MKYIITESQYRLLFEDTRTEFPGIGFFGGDWNMIENLLDNFVLNGQDIRSLKDLIIKQIRSLIEKEYLQIGGYNEGDDYGVAIYELDIFPDNILYENNNKQIITMFYLTEVTVEIFDDIEDDYAAEELYIRYKDLDIETLKEIYNVLTLNVT